MVQPTGHEEPIDAEPGPQATLHAPLVLRLTKENRLLFKRAVVEGNRSAS